MNSVQTLTRYKAWADDTFLSVVESLPESDLAAPRPIFQELADSQRQMDIWYVDYADSMSRDQLSEVVEFEFIGGGIGAMSREDILLHVVNHTTYHRGHIADMLYHLHISPPTTDLPVFLRASVGVQQRASSRS